MSFCSSASSAISLIAISAKYEVPNKYYNFVFKQFNAGVIVFMPAHGEGKQQTAVAQFETGTFYDNIASEMGINDLMRKTD